MADIFDSIEEKRDVFDEIEEPKTDQPDWKQIEADYNRRLYEPVQRPSLTEALKEGLSEGMQTVAESPIGLPAKALSFVPRPSAQQVQDVFDLVTNPTEPSAQSREPGQIAKATAGAIGVGRGVAEGLASPIGVATLGTGGLPSAAQRLVGAGFVADMASGVGEQARRAGEASVTGDTQEKVEALGNLAVTPVMASAIGLHALRPKIAETVAKVETELPGALEKTKAAVQEVANASPEPKTESVPESEIRPSVGEGTPLRQQGEVADVQAPAELPQEKGPVGQFLAEVESGKVASTNAAREFGKTITSAEDIAVLKKAYEEASQRGRDALAALPENPTEEQMAKAFRETTFKPQFINEAIEEATGASEFKGKDAAKVRELMEAGQPKVEPVQEAPAKDPYNFTPENIKLDRRKTEAIEGAIEKSKARLAEIEEKGISPADPAIDLHGGDVEAATEFSKQLVRNHIAYDTAMLEAKRKAELDKPPKKAKATESVETPARETVEPAKDTPIGKNAAGEQIYQRGDGSFYRMRFDSPQRHPNGYPDFGGDLAPVDAPPEHVSMGGATTSGPVDPRAQIDQLADAFKGVKGEKIPLSEAVKRAFDLGGQAKNVKGLLSGALEGLKNSGQVLKRIYEGVDKIDDVLRVKGELSSELNKNSWRIRQFSKQVQESLPDVKVREAIAKWIDAGGDDAVLKDALAKVPANKQAPYKRALNLTPEEKVAAQNIQQYFEARLAEAQEAGIVNEGIEDYIHRIYEKDTDWKKGALAQVQAGVLNTKTPGLALKRLFQFDSEAEAAGYNVVSDFLPRIADYESSLAKVIASRAAVKRFSEIKMPDGRPMIDVGGVGIPVPDATAPEATLIKPSYKPGDELPINDRKDYISRNYPALKKWKWVTTGENGQPVLVQGDVLIHPDAVKRVDSLLKPSVVRQSALGRGALGVSSTFKNTMLDLSGFHQVQLAVHGAEHLVPPGFEMKSIDLTDPKVEGLLKGGITLGGEPHGMNYSEGLVGRSLSRQIPGLGPLMQTYHEWLFQDYIPRLKMTMALHALERNRARFQKDLNSGKMTEEALNFLTAREANAAFGELNYIMLERSRTAQDVSRLILLAPDFLEARGRFAGQALTKRGGEQRMALLLGALTMFITARIANKILDDQYHLEPENLFNIVYKGHSYGLRTVQGDILHAATEPFRFMLHRLNPTVTRPALEALTGRDEFGRKRDGWQVLGDSIANIVPISLRSSREQNLWESIYNSMGVTTRRFNEVDSTYKLAQKWNKEHNIQEPGEFIYDRDKDPLRGLKIALSENDEVEAAKEIAELLKKGTTTRAKLIEHFNRYATSPFTGSFANDRKFAASLSEDERKTYEASRQHKKNINKLFLQALRKI